MWRAKPFSRFAVRSTRKGNCLRCSIMISHDVLPIVNISVFRRLRLQALALTPLRAIQATRTHSKNNGYYLGAASYYKVNLAEPTPVTSAAALQVLLIHLKLSYGVYRTGSNCANCTRGLPVLVVCAPGSVTSPVVQDTNGTSTHPTVLVVAPK